MHSPPISLLPKNILKAPSHNPTDQNASPAYAALPNPSAAHPLRNPDQRFLDSEAFTTKFSAHVSGPLEKVTRRTIKRYSGASEPFPLELPSPLLPFVHPNYSDLAQDHTELGATLNGFSLSERAALSSAIEKTGQAIDVTYLSTVKLVRCLMYSLFRYDHPHDSTFGDDSSKNWNKIGPNLCTSTPSSRPSSGSCSRIVIRSTCSTR